MHRRVLVAEAEPGIAPLLGRFLHLNGYAVEVAHTFEAARARLAGSAEPYLVLLDLVSASPEALAFCRELRDAPSPLPVIAMTAEVEPDLRRHALGAGCTYVLEKPFDPDVLETLVHRAMASGLPA